MAKTTDKSKVKSIGKSIKEQLELPLYIIFHPIDGFYRMKYEKEGKLWFILISLLLFWISYSTVKQYSPFLLNNNYPLDYNGIGDLFAIITLVLFWGVGNWSVTSLMDGEGKFLDILMTVAYSLTPVIIISIPAMIISYCFTINEIAFFTLVQSIAYTWFVILLFFGTLVIHNFTLSKTILIVLLTFISILIMVFLITLSLSLLSQVYTFFISIYREILYR